jgi:hypothetical protein
MGASVGMAHGMSKALREKGNHIITTQIEHPAIIQPCQFLETLGAKVSYVGVDKYGRVNPRNIEKAIKFIRVAAEKGAQMICFQELFTTHWFPREMSKRHFLLPKGWTASPL